MSRMMPIECRHGVVLDYNDFGPCQDCSDHEPYECPNQQNCPQCDLADEQDISRELAATIIADAAELERLRAIVRDLAAVEPIEEFGDRGSFCITCWGGVGRADEWGVPVPYPHQPGCPWLRATQEAETPK